MGMVATTLGSVLVAVGLVTLQLTLGQALLSFVHIIVGADSLSLSLDFLLYAAFLVTTAFCLDFGAFLIREEA